MTDLTTLNAASAEDFAAALDGIFERAPWIAAETAVARPFADCQALHAAMMQVLQGAGEDTCRSFLNAHEPLMAGPLSDSLTASSRAEQGNLPLGALVSAEALAKLNASYQQRFGIPFVIALRRHTAANVLRELHRRLAVDPAAELTQALAEVGHVARYRLLARLGEPVPGGSIVVAVPQPTHAVLDLQLSREGQVIVVRQVVPTNTGGPLPLWQEAPLRLGAYRLLVDGRPHDFHPERSEGATTLKLQIHSSA